MTDTALSALTAASALGVSDLFYVVQSGTSKRATGTQLQTFAQSSLGALAAKNSVNNGDWSGAALAVSNGGTGATSAEAGRNALGAAYRTHPGRVAGRHYPVSAQTVTQPSGAVTVANTVRLFPFMLEETTTISALGYITYAGSGGTGVQLAIYVADATTKMPTGTPVASCTAGSPGTTGYQSANLASNVQLTAGLYWMASNTDGTPRYNSYSTYDMLMNYLIGSTSGAEIYPAPGSGGNVVSHYAIAQTYGTWPDLTSASLTYTNSNIFPATAFKVASVP